ncbi:MAG: phosphodiester glycosidase family protein [Candidatus Carbobacillus altaicus]|nr:phosphodiester glycosidase family protein [Candidatus Carbobacillus altaicus]
MIAVATFYPLWEARETITTDLLSVRQALNDAVLAFEKVEAAVREQQTHIDALTEAPVKPFTEERETISRYLADIRSFADNETAGVSATRGDLERIVQASSKHIQETKDTLDTILAKKLGNPIGQTFGKRATVKVFSLKEVGYAGYMAKIKLHDPSAIRLVLAPSENNLLGSYGETVSSMAKRTGGVLAINAGGFWRKPEDGLIYPIGTTIVDGEIKVFSTNSEVSFIGFNKGGRLVGGTITDREALESLGVLQGASFLPTLIKDGKKQPIPKAWANKKEPRTLIGHFTNGDVLMIVIDGRQKGYSEGVTLEDAQDKLIGLNIRDAYNLDGGGSSTFYYNGKVLNKPSDGKERKVISSFVLFP